MSLQPGSRLGSFEVVAAVGAGGMGEVYRARDTKLNRQVAIKVLPDLFTLDADRCARFEREAQILGARRRRFASRETVVSGRAGRRPAMRSFFRRATNS